MSYIKYYIYEYDDETDTGRVYPMSDTLEKYYLTCFNGAQDFAYSLSRRYSYIYQIYDNETGEYMGEYWNGHWEG